MRAASGTVQHAADRGVGAFVCLCAKLLFSCTLLSGAVPDLKNARGSRLERGFSYSNEVVTEKPWSIHVVRVEREHPGLIFYSTMGKGATLGMGVVSEQVRSVPPELGQPVAAINGDFYEKADGYEGRPRDVQICGGEVVSSPSGHTSFWMDHFGVPHMTNVFSLFRVAWGDGKTTIPVGLNESREDDNAVLYTARIGSSTRTSGGLEVMLEASGEGPWLPLRAGLTYHARVRTVRSGGDMELSSNILVLSIGPRLAARLPEVKPGAALEVITQTLPDLSNVEVAIGGGPALVRDHHPMDWKGYVHMRHPRTAVGWNNNSIFLVEVDGRQSSSVGMTFRELADYLVKLGCDEAMNLDGGGSATLWALGAIRNRPSEGQERPSPNALVLVRKKGQQTPTAFYAAPPSELPRLKDPLRSDYE